MGDKLTALARFGEGIDLMAYKQFVPTNTKSQEPLDAYVCLSLYFFGVSTRAYHVGISKDTKKEDRTWLPKSKVLFDLKGDKYPKYKMFYMVYVPQWIFDEHPELAPAIIDIGEIVDERSA